MACLALLLQLLIAAMNYKANVMKVFSRASDADIISGRLWYRSAREIASQVGKGDFRKGAGIIAALSPMMNWKENVRIASDGAKRGSFQGTFGANCDKALRILKGENPESVLGGQKVKAFYANIVSGGQCADVTIDRHALAIALGREASEGERHKLGKKNFYNIFADAFRDASAEIGLPVSEVQAITWVTWRREKNITD